MLSGVKPYLLGGETAGLTRMATMLKARHSMS